MHKKHETFLHKVLHTLEFVIAILTLIVLIGMLAVEIYKLVLDINTMFTTPEYFVSLDTYLHSILTIVVGVCANAFGYDPCQHHRGADRSDLPAGHPQPR